MNRVLPILFNTEMVCAILDGRKEITRRLVKLPKYIQKQENGLYTLFAEGACYEEQDFEQIIDYLKKPYKPGDILYARETIWQKTGHYLDVDGETKAVFLNEFRYAATDEKPEVGWNYSWVKRPSIHMPKEAARIWLKVTDVRVERLQNITEEQALSEGVPDDLDYPISKVYCPRCRGEGLIGALSQNLGFMEVDCPDCDTAVKRFKNLWNSTIKKSDLDHYGWNVNPWVWVIEFERCEKPEKV